ncbi:putative fad-dependent oxidoreductase-like enzyme protein [Zalerion maritima]|uniref:Fad-dependent oxidoreductase-like enzyme protein n=1 Tax=Zalerion maritima TaxID=339359 RepID=A0AAD5S0B7_9PEZI|nr:putative fad-dependent oxidoreductase-like enzyme protein [Zalerion maritima]
MSDVESQGQRPNSDVNLPEDEDFVPSTPQDTIAIPCSQETIPSTQDPGSPIDPNQSFKTELNDDRDVDSAMIPSSLTPPPSSQQPHRTSVGGPSYLGIGQRHPGFDALFTPPVTAFNAVSRDAAPCSEYVAPSPDQVVGASSDELRAMLQTCIAEHAKLKMETAHYKLQFNLLTMQAEEDATRAAIEHEITRREVDILKKAESSRQARNELSVAAESAQLKYYQLKTWYEEVVAENESYRKRLRSAKRVIQSKEEENLALSDERDLLLTRIRENREHFNMLCSPGGIFHSALTPKGNYMSTPQQPRGNRRHTHASIRNDAEHGQERFAALLQALHQENNSAPTTPTTATRPAPRNAPKHTRAVQSLSSLPTTPTTRPRGEHGGLLPSVDLVPHTEPPHRFGGRFTQTTPSKGRQSRESTISAEDTEELARQAVQAAAQSSFLSHRSRHQDEDEEDIFESQASQAASEMLRRDPRESFDVASSAGSRDVTPAPVDKTAKLQARLYGGVNKNVSGQGKRQFSGSADSREDLSSSRTVGPSPNKKARVGGMSEGRRVGLGIQYSQDT